MRRSAGKKKGTGKERPVPCAPVSTLSLLRGNLVVHPVEMRMFDVRMAAA
jgi:hypothetical protein